MTARGTFQEATKVPKIPEDEARMKAAHEVQQLLLFKGSLSWESFVASLPSQVLIRGWWCLLRTPALPYRMVDTAMPTPGVSGVSCIL